MKKSPLFLLVLLIAIGANAQEPLKKRNKLKDLFMADSSGIEENLLVNAFVLEGDQPLINAKIELLRDSILVASTRSDSTGAFRHTLEFGSDYMLLFSKPDYVSKKLQVDTRDMPAEDKNLGYDLGRFHMKLYKKAPGMDLTEYEKPVAKYVYDPAMRMFIVEKKFTKKRKKQIVAKEESNKQILVEHEAKQSEILDDYDRWIRDADIEFENGDYVAAKEYYKEALALKPAAEYPSLQLKKIVQLEKEALSNKQKYNVLILQGDNAYEVENYARAKEAYENALKLIPGEAYPQEQIDKIDKLKGKLAARHVKKKDPKTYTLKNVKVGKTSAFMSELASKYPQGLTEEQIDEGSKQITRRIIVDGNIGVEYKRIKHNWGGEFYFKNGEPTTEFIWQKETEQED